MNQAYTALGVDPANPSTHVLIEILGVTYSALAGDEQETANEIAKSLNLN